MGKDKNLGDNGEKQTNLGLDTVILTLSKIIMLSISMVVTMILSRFRTYEEYGTYSQLLLVTNFLAALFMLGLPNSVNYFLVHSESEKDKSSFLSVFYTLSTVLSFFIGLVLLLIEPFIEAYFHNTAIRSYWYFLLLYPWTSIICRTIENVLVVYKKIALLVVYRISNSVCILACVIMAHVLGLHFQQYMIAVTAVNSFFSIVVYYCVRKLSTGTCISFNWEMTRRILSFSVPIGFAGMIGTLNTEMDKFLIGFFMSTEDMAIYSNAAKELPITIISASITAVLLPHITKLIKDNRSKEAIKLWRCATELAMQIISVIVAIIITFSGEIITVLYSEKYLPGENVFKVYAFMLLLRVTYFGMILNAYGKTKRILYYTTISLCINAVLNPIMFFLLGMIGPPIATLISQVCVMLLQLSCTAKITNVPFIEVYPWKRVGILCFHNTILAFIFFNAKKMMALDKYIGDGLEAAFLSIVWMGLYFMIIRKEILQNWDTLKIGG